MSAFAFRFDPNRCTGCAACAIACEIENAHEPGAGVPLGWRRIAVFNAAHEPQLPSWAASLACHHCEHPACLAACPAQAITRDAATGAVRIDAARCIGCRYCSWACPFDAPRFDRASGTAGKCTFCHPRLSEGRAPACVTACPVDALTLAERVAPPAPPPLPLLPATALGPALHVEPLRGGAPEIATAPDDPAAIAWLATAERATSRITLREEWPLLAFSALAGSLVAFVLALQLGARAPHVPAEALAGSFGALSIAALLASLAHLGRPGRAWRAVLHWRRSWLSREVVLMPLYFATATAWLLVSGTHPHAALRTTGAVVAALGLAAAFALDAVYGAIVPVTGRLSPGRTRVVGPVLAGSVLVAALAAGLLPLALLAAAWKLHFGLTRLRGACRLRAAGPLLALRLGALLALPLALAAGGPHFAGSAALLALAGEWLERALFYAALEPSSPRAELDAALAAALETSRG